MPTSVKYGTVSDLCAYLGYIGTNHKSPRSKSTLSSATIDHRRQFMAMRPGLKQFPTDENADEARECARSFVESNPEFFEDSEEAFSRGFPIFPQDQNKIIGALTRLMCQQEHTSRLNTQKCSNKKISSMSRYTIDLECENWEWTSDYLKGLTPVRFDDNVFETNFEDNNRALSDRTHSDTYIQADTYETPPSRKRAYTLSTSAAGSEGPPTPKRQMNEKGLECLDPSTITVKPGEPELRIAIGDQQSRTKPQSTVFTDFRRSPSSQLEYAAFQDLCSPASQLDTQQRTTTPPLSPVEQPQPKSSANKPSLIVRLRLPKAFASASAGHTSEKNTELQRHEALESDQVTVIGRQGISDPTRKIPMGLQNKPGQLPRLMIETNHGPSSTNMTPETQEPHVHTTVSTNMIPITPMTPLLTPQTAICASASADQITAVDRRSISCGASSAFLKCQPLAEIRPKPALQFMFQRPNGRPDRKNLMPRKALFDLSLSELFLVVSSRTNKPLDSITCVTLRYLGWGEGEALVVQKDGSEEDWDDTKEEILIVFKDAIGEYSKKKEFLVWIKCGDRTRMEQKHDSDSDR